jgi:uncharacterized protein (TIGR02172 family)
MNEVSGENRNGILTLFLSGRISSANAVSVEEEIGKLRAVNPPDNMLIDAGNLEYISSAGLRIILRLKKSFPEMKIVNVPGSVYEIFEMTGFTEMMPVEKMYRRLSVEGCEVIGKGANGTVCRLDPETVIKVYRDPDSLPDIKRERELAHKAFVLGIPTAIPYDVVRVGDGYGSVFELLNAESLAQLLQEHPEKTDEYVGYFTDLLKLIHGTKVQPGEMPDMKAVATGWADFLKDYLPEDTERKLLSLLKAVPDRHTVIHGDYHIKNVIMQNGEALLIDMDTLSMGHPVFELASMYLGFVGFGECAPEEAEDFLGISYPASVDFWKRSLRRYLDTEDPEKIDEVETKSRIIGCARLLRRTIRRNGFETEQGKKIAETCRRHITEDLCKTDSLYF